MDLVDERWLFSNLSAFMRRAIACLRNVYRVERILKLKKWLLLITVVPVTICCCFYILSDAKSSDAVGGWESNVNRNASAYVLPDEVTTLVRPFVLCDSLITIVVCSAPENGALRRAIRDTWAANATDVRILFLIGVSRRSWVNEDVRNEIRIYNDIIVEDFIDSYNNLTLKSIFMLKWMKHNCPRVPYLMKMDDDAYLNLPNLVKYIKSLSGDVKGTFLAGKLYTKEKPDRRSSFKWYMPYYMFPDNVYPHYLCGVGYVMSHIVANNLYEMTLKTDILHIEDLFITGVSAKKAGIRPADNVLFHFFERPVTVECQSVHEFMILLSHHNSPGDLRKQHNEILHCL